MKLSDNRFIILLNSQLLFDELYHCFDVPNNCDCLKGGRFHSFVFAKAKHTETYSSVKLTRSKSHLCASES